MGHIKVTNKTGATILLNNTVIKEHEQKDFAIITDVLNGLKSQKFEVWVQKDKKEIYIDKHQSIMQSIKSLDDIIHEKIEKAEDLDRLSEFISTKERYLEMLKEFNDET